MKILLLIAGTFIAFTVTSLRAQVYVKLVKEINRGAGSSQPFNLTVANDRLFFIAYNGTDYKLAVTQGDSATTIFPGPSALTSYMFTNLVAFKNKVYFGYNDILHGQELWVSDGTVAGTKMVKDIYPGITGSLPLNFTVTGGKMVFTADSPEGNSRLFVTDGTSAGTRIILNNYSTNFNGALHFVTLGNKILFNSDDGSKTGHGLFITDGTITGTKMLRGNFNAANAAGNSVTLNGRVYFAADDNVHGQELWASNGTVAGTYLVKNINPEPGGAVYGNSIPQGFCVYKNKLYFSADNGAVGQELWVSDGTEAGTYLVKDIIGGSLGSKPYHNIVYKGKLYLSCWEHNELWVSDGTDTGTKKVEGLIQNAQFAAIWRNEMYLESAAQPDIIVSRGTSPGTFALYAANYPDTRVYFQSSDNYFAEYKGELYFSGNVTGLTNGYELVKITTALLPLTLLNFNGQMQKNEDVLSWQTATEVNTAYFEVQQVQPGGGFAKAGAVAAAGNSSTLQSYTFQQSSSINPAGYYRLKMADKNGATSYSNIIHLARTSSANAVKAYYNNGTRQIIIQNSSNSVCNWQLYSTGGSLVKKGASAGGTITISARGISGGVYILTCQSPAGSTAKFSLPVF